MRSESAAFAARLSEMHVEEITLIFAPPHAQIYTFRDEAIGSKSGETTVCRLVCVEANLYFLFPLIQISVPVIN